MPVKTLRAQIQLPSGVSQTIGSMLDYKRDQNFFRLFVFTIYEETYNIHYTVIPFSKYAIKYIIVQKKKTQERLHCINEKRGKSLHYK